MDNVNTVTGAATARQPRGYCWVSIAELEPGMVLARPVIGGTGMHATIHVAAGSLVTGSTIAQLINKGVECVAVEQLTAPDPEAFATKVQAFEARLDEIFGPAPDASCALLLAALKEDGPCQC